MVDKTYRDWIPPGEDPGAQGEVFRDYVPSVIPQKKEELKVENVVEEVFKCDKCKFTTKFKLALAGHSRKHK
jgi:hypothetical protein